MDTFRKKTKNSNQLNNYSKDEAVKTHQLIKCIDKIIRDKE